MKIAGILVLYNPKLQIFGKCLESLFDQLDKLVIIDNSPYFDEKITKLSKKDKCIYFFMDGNKGIAAAQNKGIDILNEYTPSYILFMDQDSIAPSDMVQCLLNKANELNQTSVKLGAIGPRAVNRQDFKEYKGAIKKGVKYTKNLTEVTELISSGSLIPFDNFKIVGDMDSNLFIDGVDHEWCWRAKKKGNFRFFILEDIKLSHQLGEGDHNFLWKRIPIPTPFRVYYQFRNYFLLVRRDYVPFYWKISNGIKYFIKFFYYPIFISPRSKYLINMLKGIYDGIIRK